MNIGAKVKVLNGIFAGSTGTIDDMVTDDTIIVRFVNGHEEQYDRADLELVESSDDDGE
jgi:hypothetical protein